MPRVKSRKCGKCNRPGHNARTCVNIHAKMAQVKWAAPALIDGNKPPANGHSKSIEYLKYRASTLGDQLRAINLAIAELDAAGE